MSVLAIAVAIPQADDTYYRHQLNSYCHSRAGVTIAGHANPIYGLLNESVFSKDSFISQTKLAFVEAPNRASGERVGFLRIDMLPTGVSSDPYPVERSQAKYELVVTKLDTVSFIEVIEEIRSRDTGLVLGQNKSLFYYGGWFRRSIFGRGAMIAGCEKSGRVVKRDDWKQDQTRSIEGAMSRRLALVNTVFAKQ